WCRAAGGSRTFVDLEQVADGVQLLAPGRVRAVAAKGGFDVRSPTSARRLELSDGPAAAHDREVLAAVLHRIEEIGEVAGRLGGAHVRHEIRSDWRPWCAALAW